MPIRRIQQPLLAPEPNLSTQSLGGSRFALNRVLTLSLGTGLRAVERAKSLRVASCANKKGRTMVDPAHPVLQKKSGVVVKRASLFFGKIISPEGK
jgi:hypothetical protein